LTPVRQGAVAKVAGLVLEHDVIRWNRHHYALVFVVPVTGSARSAAR